MTVIQLGLSQGNAVYHPDYQLKFFKQGDPSKPITGASMRSLVTLQTSKNIQDISGTFTLTMKDQRFWGAVERMDVVSIRLRGHSPDFPTVLVGVVDTVQPVTTVTPTSAQRTVTITGRCTAKYLQSTSLFLPVWDPQSNIPTALTFGQGDSSHKTGWSPQAIFGGLLRRFTFGVRNMVGESGIPTSRYWLKFPTRWDSIQYQIPFMQFDEDDMGTVLKDFEILGFTEAWVDELGAIVYRKPQWDAPYGFTLPTGQITSPLPSDGDLDVYTYIEVIPAANPGISSSAAQALLAGRAPVPSSYLSSAQKANAGTIVASPEFVIDTNPDGTVTSTGLQNYWYRKQLVLGVRPYQVTSPLLATQADAQAQAEGLLQFLSRTEKTATFTIPGDPRARMGANVRVHGRLNARQLDRTYYIEGVAHDYQEGDSQGGGAYTTTLTCTHGRDPSDPRWGSIVLPSATTQKVVQSGGIIAPTPQPKAGSNAASLRDLIVQGAQQALANDNYTWNQVRPMAPSLFSQAALTTTDCSAFATLDYKWAGAPDPNGPTYNYNGQGDSSSLYAYGTPTNTPLHGDLAFWGVNGSRHVAVYIGGYGGVVPTGAIIELGSTPIRQSTVADETALQLLDGFPFAGYRTYPFLN